MKNRRSKYILSNGAGFLSETWKIFRNERGLQALTAVRKIIKSVFKDHK